jgi:hypothetical protein
MVMTPTIARLLARKEALLLRLENVRVTMIEGTLSKINMALNFLDDAASGHAVYPKHCRHPLLRSTRARDSTGICSKR